MPRVKKTTTDEKKEEQKTVPQSQKKKSEYYFAVGRRKTAIARVKLMVVGNGTFTVNGEMIDKYFPGQFMKMMYLLPFKLRQQRQPKSMFSMSINACRLRLFIVLESSL